MNPSLSVRDRAGEGSARTRRGSPLPRGPVARPHRVQDRPDVVLRDAVMPQHGGVLLPSVVGLRRAVDVVEARALFGMGPAEVVPACVAEELGGDFLAVGAAR